jgi:hypothetical protein
MLNAQLFLGSAKRLSVLKKIEVSELIVEQLNEKTRDLSFITLVSIRHFYYGSSPVQWSRPR